MARLLGDRLLPESVQSRRRTVRTRLNDIREPVRSFRESNIPGPDLIGMLENQASDLRSSFIDRESVVASLRDMMGSENGGSGGSGGSSGSNSSNNQDATSRGASGESVRA